MAVVGVDIGDYSTYISVAKPGAVDTISNDYSLRGTPSVVAFGDRQRFVGVSAENQRNLTPKNTVSYFKNTIGRTYKSVDSVKDSFGAEVSRDDTGKLVFHIQNKKFQPEQLLAMIFTKVRELVTASEGEDIETLVVSVPAYFTAGQRRAVLDAAGIAGVPVSGLLTDTSALALSYGKNKEVGAEPRNVVLVDCGSEGTQAVLVSVTQHTATVLASSTNHVGGKVFDDILVEHAVTLVQEKYKLNIATDNAKVRNKLRNALDKAKKQMSVNTNPLPVQIDSLAEDIDVQFTISRAKFEELIKEKVGEIRETLENLLASTTVKPDQIHSVEIVGGSSRIPIIKSTIQEVFGVVPSTTLNTDEAVSRGCALHAAELSSRFLVKRFEVQDTVHYGVEAVFVHGGKHEKVLVCDEGESAGEERSIEVTADLPLSIALQYLETSGLENNFIALYKVDQTDAASGVFKLTFRFDKFGLLELEQVLLVSEERRKRRKSAEPEAETEAEMAPCRTVLKFTKSMPERMNISELAVVEQRMVEADLEEIRRQEEKNRVEELLYRLRHQLLEHADQVDQEEAFISLKTYFDDIENWLYEEGEDAPRQSYRDMQESLSSKMKIYTIWLEKFMQMKAREQEKKQFLEQQQQHQQRQQQREQGGQRQIPIVYEGGEDYVPKPRGRGGFPTGFANRREPFPRDPFQRMGSQFMDESMFGW